MSSNILQGQAQQIRPKYIMPLNGKLLAKNKNSGSKLFSKSSRNVDVLDAVYESPVGPTVKVSEREWGQIPHHRRAESTKNSTFKKMLTSADEIPDETPLVIRKNSDISLASVRTMNQTFSKFHSRAASTDRRFQYGPHFFITSSPEPSHTASLGEFGQSEMVTEHATIKKRTEELITELVSAIKAHDNQIEQLMNELGGQVHENNTRSFDEKMSELIESVVSETAGLGAIEWENKLKNVKRELDKASGRNEHMAQSWKATQLQIQADHKEQLEIARILGSKTTPDVKVKELSALLDEKKRNIQQIELKRAKSERETKDLRVLLKRKQEEIDFWSTKAEKFVCDNKAKDARIRETTSALTKVKKNIELKTRENTNLIWCYSKLKEEMIAKNKLQISALEAKATEFIAKSKDIDQVYGKLAKQERDAIRLNSELQASAEEIRRLEEELEKEERATEKKVKTLHAQHEGIVLELNKKHLLKMQRKNNEIKTAQTQLQELSRESLIRQRLIGKITSDNENLKKKKIHDQINLNASKEEFFTGGILQLKRRVLELSSILEKNNELKSTK